MDFHVAIASNDDEKDNDDDDDDDDNDVHYGRYKAFVYLIVMSWCAHTTEVHRNKQLLHIHSTFLSPFTWAYRFSVFFFICSFVWLLSATVRIKSYREYIIFCFICSVLLLLRTVWKCTVQTRTTYTLCTCVQIPYLTILTNEYIDWLPQHTRARAAQLKRIKLVGL